MSIVIPEPSGPSNPYLNRITLVQGDITQQDVDAVVTLLPQSLEYRGRVNEAIAASANEDLDPFIREHIHRPVVGDVFPLPGFGLPCRHIFFCIIPTWRTDFDRQEKHLVQATRRAMETAESLSLKTIAFPPLASGRYGFPKPRAARLIIKGIEDRLDKTFNEVRIVCLKNKSLRIFEERLNAQGWIG